jgi:hypothetical protein
VTPYKERQALWQGSLDDLCGIYALVNASRLLVPSLTNHACKQVFKQAIRWICDRNDYPDMLCEGLDADTMARLHKDVFEPRWRLSLHRPFYRRTPQSAKEFWLWMEKEAARQRQAVIICFESRHWNHWTVVRDITPTKVTLFDSNGLYFLKREGCGHTPEHSTTHVIAPENVLLLRENKPLSLLFSL